MNAGRAYRHLWIVLLLLQASVFLFVIGDRRTLTGGPTRDCFLLQQAALTGAPAAGVDRTSYLAQDGLLQQALLLAPGAAAGMEARTWFYLGLLVDELLLLVGIWLLARSLFADVRTTFLVAVATIGSSLWVDQVWSNFRSFHALPLLLWLARTYRGTGSPFLLAAALNLAGLQAMGKPPGQALLAPLAALLAMRLFREFLEPVNVIVDHRRRGALAAGVASWIPAVFLAMGSSGPTPPPRPFLQSLLDFSSLNNPGTFLDVALGLAPAPDFTLYCGFFTLGFAILAVARSTPRVSLRVAGAIAVLVLVLGLASATVDRLLPSIHSTRGAAGAPLLRLILILLAGLGFEQALRRPAVPGRAVPCVAWGLVLFGATLILASILLRYADFQEGAARLFVPRAPEGTLSPHFRNRPLVRELLDTAALWAMIAGGVMLLARPGARTAPLAIALILFLHPFDVFGWKFRMTWLRTKSQTEVRAPVETDGSLLAPGSKVAAGVLGVQALLWITGIIGVTARMRRIDDVHAKSTVG